MYVCGIVGVRALIYMPRMTQVLCTHELLILKL